MEREEGKEQRRIHIFIASNCSFFGTISSIYGASSGYVVTNCVRSARCTEDLTFDFEPGDRLVDVSCVRAEAEGWIGGERGWRNGDGIYSFLNIAAVVRGVWWTGEVVVWRCDFGRREMRFLPRD